MTGRVVVVRGSRSPGTAGGCCSGDVRPFDEGAGHAHAALVDEPDEAGALWLALRERLPAEVDVQLVQPGNWLWLVPVLLSDGRRRGLRGRALLRALRAGTTPCTVVVDGRPAFVGRLPATGAAVTAVEAELALR